MASPFTAKQRIETPFPAAEPRYGLLFAADKLAAGTLGGIDNWPNGLAWAPERAGGGGAVLLNCYGGTATMTAATTNPEITTADPFVVWAEDHCSTLGWNERDWEGRAIRQLDATRSFHMANELWLGTQAKAGLLNNDWLTNDPKVVSGAAVAPAEAFAQVEMGLGLMLGGRRGMIHVSPQVLDELHSAFALELSGQLWLSPMGHIVVADAGYPGTGPDSGAGSTHQWIYGTSLVDYLLGPVQVGDPRTSTNRSINLTVLYASQEAILLWDWNIPAGTKHGVIAAETTTAAFAAL